MAPASLIPMLRSAEGVAVGVGVVVGVGVEVGVGVAVGVNVAVGVGVGIGVNVAVGLGVALDICVSVSVLLLLVRMGSVTPAGAVIVAMSERGPRADAVIVPRAV